MFSWSEMYNAQEAISGKGGKIYFLVLRSLSPACLDYIVNLVCAVTLVLSSLTSVCYLGMVSLFWNIHVLSFLWGWNRGRLKRTQALSKDVCELGPLNIHMFFKSSHWSQILQQSLSCYFAPFHTHELPPLFMWFIILQPTLGWHHAHCSTEFHASGLPKYTHSGSLFFFPSAPQTKVEASL